MSEGYFFAGFNSSVKLRMPQPCVRLSSPGLPGPAWGGVADKTFHLKLATDPSVYLSYNSLLSFPEPLKLHHTAVRGLFVDPILAGDSELFVFSFNTNYDGLSEP
ncbi:hypothetical protein YC2023_089188 [Brassica napus]